MRKLFTIAAIMSCAVSSYAQDTVISLSLEDCLHLSDSNNPYVKNSELDVLSAKSLKSELTWEYFPTADINGIGYYAAHPLVEVTMKDIFGTSDAAWELNNTLASIASENGIKTRYSTLQKGYGVTLSAMHPLYAGGRIINGNKLAATGIRASRLQADMKVRDIREDVEKKYWTTVALQEKEKTLLQAEAMLDTLYRQVSAAREAGIATEADLSKVQIKRKELASGKVALSSGLKLSKMDLFNAIGFKYEYLKLDSYTLSEQSDLTVGPSQAVSEKTGLPVESELLEIQLEAKKLEKKVAVGEYLPQVGVGVSYGYGDIQGRNNGRFNGIGFASVKIPLTGIGKAGERAKRYNYEIQKIQNEKEYLDSQLQLQQHQLYLAVETAYEQAKVAERALKDAENATRRISADYHSGRSTVSELLQTEMDERSAREDFIDRCIDYRLAITAYRCRYCR